MRVEAKGRWPLTLTIAGCATAGAWFLFNELLHIVWPTTVLGGLLPALRENVPSF